MPEPIIDNTISFVKQSLRNAEGGHDWFHTERVWKMACRLSDEEQQGDRLIIELAALLHDIADAKFNEGDEKKSGKIATGFLQREGLDPGRINRIREIIDHISFKGGQEPVTDQSIEFRIVQDADRLDALGAIGIARAFSYGGYRNRLLYDPSVKPRQYPTVKAYRSSSAPTIQHFYEKLLKLKDSMHTSSARMIAGERHRYMESYLDQFFGEWNGKR